jgi:hypothetical protein
MPHNFELVGAAVVLEVKEGAEAFGG